jgi:5-(carboxyamino)imidazole ribonucleotide mutase
MVKKPVAGIIMGSDSDFGVMEKAFEVFKSFDTPYEVKILSAHRTPNQHKEYCATAEKRGLKVIIAAAGGAAHLPGVTAAHTSLPVIGVPIKGKSLEGMDSLLSIVQMPPGVPVATVSIDGAKNAALLALQIISLTDTKLKQKYKRYRLKTEKESMAKNKKLNF